MVVEINIEAKITMVHVALVVCVVGALFWYGFSSPTPSLVEANKTSMQQSDGGALVQQNTSCSLADAAANCAEGVRITLIKFHGNAQCTSCMNLGKFANATLQAGYAAELASGAIRYLDINAEAEPNNELVLRYRPTHASLYLAVDGSGAESFEELVQAWYYTGDESAYSQYLSGVIDARLR